MEALSLIRLMMKVFSSYHALYIYILLNFIDDLLEADKTSWKYNMVCLHRYAFQEVISNT
jgi:hypothetical protein